MKMLTAIFLLAAGTTAALAAEPSAPILREKCGDDIKKLCPDAKPGDGIAQCLQQNESKLSQACKDALNAMRRPIERPNATRPN